MSKKGKKDYIYNKRSVKQIILQRINEPPYWKSVPQTDVSMYALNIKEDGSGAHIYLHKPGGSEETVDGQKKPIWVRKSQLISKEINSGESVEMVVKNNSSTCTFTAIHTGNKCEIIPEYKCTQDAQRILELKVNSDSTDKIKLFGAFLDNNSNPIDIDNSGDTTPNS